MEKINRIHLAGRYNCHKLIYYEVNETAIEINPNCLSLKPSFNSITTALYRK